jgi:predicted nuclease of predicted toxin-antitoxin system
VRFLVDQCVYSLTIKYLRDLGHDVVTAEDLGLQRADDSLLLAKSVELNRAFLTRDLDLADLRYYPPAYTAGIVVLRMTPATADRVHVVLPKFLTSGVELSSALPIIDQNKYRVRRQW